MLGSVFAGTEEAPGEVVHKAVVLPESQKTVKVPFKVLRGMASIEAIRDRLDVEEADTRELEAIGAEGMEISVPARGSARTIVRDMMKHLCSSISYGGASTLAELRAAVLGGSGAVSDQAVGVRRAANRTSGRHSARLAAPPRRPVTASRVLQRFFKTGPGEYAEGDVFIGVRVPALRRSAGSAAVPASRRSIRCSLPVHEERLLALLLLVDAFKRGT